MNTWTLRAYYPKANGFYGAGVYSLSGMPCCTGGGNTSVSYFADSNAYNETVNVWSSRVALPAPVRGEGPGGFALNNLGYVCGGYTSAGAMSLSSVYQYQDGVRDYRVRVALPKFGILNQGTFTRQRGNFPVTVNGTYAFNLNGFGYAGGGQLTGGVSASSSFYQYAEPLDTWSARLSSTGIVGSLSFALNGFGYVVGGIFYSGGWVVQNSAAFYNDSVGTWSSVQPCLAVRWCGTGFVLNGYGYILGGRTSLLSFVTSYVDRYNDSLNSWLAMPNLGTARGGVGFVLNGLGYMVGGYNGSALTSVMSEFNDSGFYEKIVAVGSSFAIDGQGSFSFKGYGYSVCGNVAGAPSSAVYRYNNDIAYWRRAEPIPPTATARYSIYSGFSTNNAGYTVGSHDGTNPQPSVFAICHQDEYVRVAATLKIEE
jgi:hypothetical protein